MRRLYQPGFINRYFVGDGIDIGAGTDGLGAYRAQFPLMTSCRSWDLGDGDAQVMDGVADAQYDFVHSAHSLEHMRDPVAAFGQWVRILRPGGHLVLVVPDEDLYEQGHWPSQYNPDHKWTFTIFKPQSWSPVSVSLTTFFRAFDVTPIKLELLEHTYDQAQEGDQTRGLAESAIECIVRKYHE